MLAQQDNIFEETCETIFQMNQDDEIRYWCEAFEEGERVTQTIEQNYEKKIAEQNAIIAEKDSALAEMNNVLAEQNKTLAEKDTQIAFLLARLNQK